MPSRSVLGDALAIARYHIMGVAVAAALAFSWLLTGRYQPLVAAACALDWFLINLFNRITDIDEDLANGIRGTDRVARSKGLLTAGAFALLVGSLAATAIVAPRLLAWRLAVQAIGLAYSYRLVPTPSGMKRMKELYFFKNFMSAVLFVLTCFCYPLATAPRITGFGTVAVLVVFFIPFELTYEVLYDLRDIDGDRREGIPTYPVVHGPEVARRVIDGLLALSAAALVVGIAVGWLGVREALMLAAPVVQRLVYLPWYRRGVTARDCILVTHLGTAQLVLFLVGTRVWLALGLPANVYLR